jgi:membrane protease YdiL (CAAX protease family)
MATASRERPILQPAIALLSGLGLGVGGLLIGFILTLVAFALVAAISDGSVSPTLQIVISLIFIQGIGCAGVALSYYRLRPAITTSARSLFDLSEPPTPFRIPAAVPDLRDVLVIVGGYGGAIASAILGSILITIVQEYTGANLEGGTNAAAELGMENPEVLLLLIPASIFVIGPGEELLFRGVVQARIREMFSVVPGIFIPSVIFASLHWFAISGGSVGGNLAALGILTVLALVLGVAYEYTDNIVVPSLIHGLYNATRFSILYLTVAYGDQLPQ